MEKKEGYKKTEIGWIPKDWDLKIIGDFTEKVIGGASLKPTDFTTDGFKVLPKKGIVPGGFLKINENEQAYCSLDYASSNIGNIVDNKYLITTLRDLVPTGPSIGYIVKFDSAEQYILAQGVYGFKTTRELDRDFLIQFSNTKHYRKTMQTIMVGSTQVHIRNKDFLNVSIPYPPLPEQQKIADILTTVDDKISSTDSRIQQTEQLKKGLMEKLLTEGVGHTEFKETEIGRIPVEWDIVELYKISKILRGASPRPKGDPRYYGGTVPRLMIKDVTRDGKIVIPKIDSLTKEGAKKSRFVPKGTLVLSCSGTVVGYPSVLGVDACIHDGFMAFVDISERGTIEYLYYLFSFNFSRFNQSATHGGVLTNLTTQAIKNYLIPLPPLPEQKQIATILSSVDDKLDILTQKKSHYQTLKKGLSQQLLTGQMRVKV